MSTSKTVMRGSLATGSVGRHLTNLTIPMFLGISSMITASMFDAVYVGWIGTLELAAVSMTFPVVMGLSSLTMGIGTGASSIIARTIGSGDEGRMRRLTTHSMLLSMISILILALAGITFSESIFRGLGANEQLLPYVLEYLSVWFLGLPAFALPMVATSIMRSVGNARLPAIIMTTSAILQVMLTPLLMFGIPATGFEGLGFIGSAWGFVISRSITLVYTFVVMFTPLKLIELKIPVPSEVLNSWAEVLRIAVPSTLTGLIGPVSMAIVLFLLSPYGPEVIAGFGVASRIEMLSTMIMMALASSTAPFIGQNWGARQFDRIHAAQRLGYQFCFGWGLFAALMLVVFGRQIVGLINSDPGVIEATYTYLLIIPATYGIFGASMIASSTFVALGKPIPTLIMSIGRMLVLYVPMAFLGDWLWGYPGIFAATATANVLMGIVSMWWVRIRLRKEISRAQLVEPIAIAAD